MRFIFALDSRFMRFLATGVLNTAVGYALFALFIAAGLHYAVATLLATTLSVAFNFLSTGRFVFKKTGREYLLRFISVYALLYVVNILLLKTLLVLSVSAYLAGFLLLPVMAILGYLLQSRITFRDVYPKNSPTDFAPASMPTPWNTTDRPGN
jgi:putative flippase GtrA